MKKPDINAVLAVSVRRQLDDANSVIARLTQERHELREKLETAIEALDHIDCGNAQCRDGYGGCDHRCALHARAAVAHLRVVTPVSAEPQPETPRTVPYVNGLYARLQDTEYAFRILQTCFSDGDEETAKLALTYVLNAARATTAEATAK